MSEKQENIPAGTTDVPSDQDSMKIRTDKNNIPENANNMAEQKQFEITQADAASSASQQHPEQETPKDSGESCSSVEKNTETDVQSAENQDTQNAQEQKTELPSLWERVFNSFAHLGPVMLFVALALMIWPDFWQIDKAFYCPAESRTISAFLHCISQNSWLTPTGLDNASWSLPQWPVFFWFAGLLAAIPVVTDSGLLMPLAGAISGAMVVLSVWILAETAGFGYRAAFAAGLILLCSPLFAPLPHFIGPATLAAALMLLSLACFCRGWQAKRAGLSLPLAFALSGLAGLCGGPLFIILPLLASLVFLVWRGSLCRAQSLDAMIGFALMLLLIGAWLTAIILGKDSGNYLSMLFKGMFSFSWPPQPGWWLAMSIAAIGILPWILMTLGVSWFRVLAKCGKTLGASRHENGSALIWISLVLCCGLSIYIPQVQLSAIVIVCLMAILLGKAFVNLHGLGNRFFFLLASLCLIAAGVIQLAASFKFSQEWLFAILPAAFDDNMAKMLMSLKTLPILGAICLSGGIAGLFFVKRCRQAGGLVYGTLLAIIISQSALLMLVPELGARQDTGLVTFASIQAQVQNAPGKQSYVPDNPSEPVQPEAMPDLNEPEKQTSEAQLMETKEEIQAEPEKPDAENKTSTDNNLQNEPENSVKNFQDSEQTAQ